MYLFGFFEPQLNTRGSERSIKYPTARRLCVYSDSMFKILCSVSRMVIIFEFVALCGKYTECDIKFLTLIIQI